MTLRNMLLVAAAVAGFAGITAGEASAKPFFLFRPFLPGYNDSYPPPDDIYYMDEEGYYQYLKRQRRKQRMLDEYYASQGYYDDYEQDYVPPRKARKKQAAKPDEQAPVVRKKKPAAAEPVKKQAAKKKKATAPSTVASLPKATAPAKSESAAPVKAGGAAMSCNRAADIVAGYGFDSVKAGSCSGNVYSFNAVRSGKSYLVKVNSASGELTEVKKL